MTVNQLIAELQRLVAEAPETGAGEVATEGCDCHGDVGSVAVDRNAAGTITGVTLERSVEEVEPAPPTAEERAAEERKAEHAALGILVGLASHYAAYLAAHPTTPSLYKSGLAYRPQVGSEELRDINVLLEAGHIDVDEMVAWRVAELRALGVDAQPILTRLRQQLPHGEAVCYSACVRWPDGTVEHPLQLLRAAKP